jgi:hypothetical protein
MYVISVMPSSREGPKLIPLPPSLTHGQTHKGDRVPIERKPPIGYSSLFCTVP